MIRVRGADLEAVASGALGRLPCQVFTTSDGLVNLECPGGLQQSKMRDRRGRLWFATFSGVAMVEPGTVTINPLPPPVYVEKVSYRDRLGRYHELPWTNQEQVIAPPGCRELGLNFAALCYSAPEKVQIAYLLEGQGEHWTDITGRRSLYFHTPVSRHHPVASSRLKQRWGLE